jgi:hypothetical protein
MAINIDLTTSDAVIYDTANDPLRGSRTLELRAPSGNGANVLVYAEGLHSGYPADDGAADEGTGFSVAAGTSAYLRMGKREAGGGIGNVHAKMADGTGEIDCFAICKDV